MCVARKIWILAITLTASLAMAAPDSSTATTQQSANKAIIDSIFSQEGKLAENMHKYTPLVETYIQNTTPNNELGEVPVSDKYFLGRLVLDKGGINEKTYDKKKAGAFTRVLDRLNSYFKTSYVPASFVQLLFLGNNFDNKNYDLKYQRQEFLGDVRTLVFDVVPHKKIEGPHFIGRIWVEDQEHNIVRINGTYEPQTSGYFSFHFDSWRMNMQPGLWLPALVYTEDGDMKDEFDRKVVAKGQTRVWGYDLKHSGQQTEFTDMQVESVKDVSDQSGDGANEVSPLESRRKWQREAEDNVLDRMERAGVLAPAGEVSKVLETVVSNLEITNNLSIQPDVRCRVLLTTPLESFTVGNTIVISRGLLDVLPDEASLAMMLSHELAHIALGHSVDTKYAFIDHLMFPDEKVMQGVSVQQDQEDESAADKKAVELLTNSPYKDKLSNAGLFLRALQSNGPQLTWLINPNFGNKMVKGTNVLRMGSLLQSAPELKVRDPQQLAALPLGSRIKLDPWDDHVSLKKSKPEAVLSAREKLPFEVTPMIPNLVRTMQSLKEVAENTGGKTP
jgi:hypothetical protein